MCSDACKPGENTGDFTGTGNDLFYIYYSAFFSQLCLTECSSESDVCEVMTGLKLVGERGLSFFLMARICSRALNAKRKEKFKLRDLNNLYVSNNNNCTDNNIYTSGEKTLYFEPTINLKRCQDEKLGRKCFVI